MVNLVKLENNIPVISSMDIAKGFDLKHNAVLMLIRKYEIDLQDIETFKFKILKSGGRPTTYCFLNEEQSIFLVTLMRNSKKTVKFKRKLSNEFMRIRNALNQIAANQKNAEWLEKRKRGKVARLIQTDEIKRFVEYAEKNGSTNAKRYYGLISTAENKALFFLEQKFSNVRDVLQGHQLETMSNADRIVSKQLKKCVDENIDYHKGYYMAKEAVETFAGLIGKTLVPMTNQKQLN